MNMKSNVEQMNTKHKDGRKIQKEGLHEQDGRETRRPEEEEEQSTDEEEGKEEVEIDENNYDNGDDDHHQGGDEERMRGFFRWKFRITRANDSITDAMRRSKGVQYWRRTYPSST